jgi:outer membrane protein TolC
MGRKAFLLALGLLAALPRRGGAEMTWQDCVTLALRRNPELASSQYSVKADLAGYKGSFNGLLPRLDLSDSYSDSQGATGASRYSAEAGLSLNVWSPSQLAKIRSASAALKQSEAALRRTSAGLRFELRRAFAQVLLSQERVRVSETVKDIRERGARMVQLRYQAGRESKGNMLRTQAELLRAEADLSQARRSLRTAQMALSRQLGMDEYRALSASGTFATAEPPSPELDLKPGVSERPDVAFQEAALRAAKAGLAQARSVLWPTLSASYNRSWTGREQFPNDRNSWSAGGTLSLPLFGGGPTAAYHSVSAALSGVRGSEEALRAARVQALDDLESARADFAGAVDQVRVQDALLEASRQRNAEADIRYASGLLSFDNWELIVSDRVSSERQNLQARFNAVVAEASWARAIGKTLGDS